MLLCSAGFYSDATSFVITTAALLLVANVSISFGSYFIISLSSREHVSQLYTL